MSGTFTVKLDNPVTAVRRLDDRDQSLLPDVSPDGSCVANGDSPAQNQFHSGAQAQLEAMRDLEKQKAEVADLSRMLRSVVGQINRLYEGLLAGHNEEIARLSVEIARKILMQQVQKGDYQIESIVKAALENAPTHQDVVVHLNPADLAQLQKLQGSSTSRSKQDDSSGAFTGIKFVADPGIGRAECLVETPKGIIKSLIDEHIRRVSEALERASSL